MPDRPWSDPGHDIRGDLERARELALEPAPYEPDYWPCPWCPPIYSWLGGALLWHVEEVHPAEWADLLESMNAVARGLRAVAANIREERVTDA